MYSVPGDHSGLVHDFHKQKNVFSGSSYDHICVQMHGSIGVEAYILP